MSGIILPESAANLARYETVLSDRRVEALWARISKELNFGSADVQFASYLQPPRTVEKGGRVVSQAETVVFLVVSPNPHPRHKGRMIKSYAVTPERDWVDAEREAAHFVGMGDPAYPIYKALSRQHLEKRQAMVELH